MGLPKKRPDEYPDREYPKLYESHTGRAVGGLLYGASGAALLFFVCTTPETVKIKIHSFAGKIWKFVIDRKKGLLYNIMMQLVWSLRPSGLGF